MCVTLVFLILQLMLNPYKTDRLNGLQSYALITQVANKCQLTD